MIFCCSSVKIRYERKLNTVFPCYGIRHLLSFKNRTRVFLHLQEISLLRRKEMKKKFTAAAVSACVVMLVSCSMTMPETVAVKTDATYKLNVGTYSKKISDYFTVKTLSDKMQSTDSKMKVYDYNPGGNASVMQFLIDYPIAEIPIDVGSYFQNMDLSSDLSDISFNKTINIPKFDNKNFTQTISFAAIEDRINANSSIGAIDSLPLLEPGQGLAKAASTSPLTLEVSKPEFSTITYSQGTLVVTFVPQGTVSAGFTAAITLSLQKSDGTEITSSSSPVDISYGGSISLPLAGKTLYKSMKLVIGGTVSGGTALKTDTYAVSAAYNSTKLSSITGLTMTKGEVASPVSINQTIDMSSSSFVTATIKEGSVAFSAPLPSGWSGVLCTPSVTLSGGLTAADSEFVDGGGSYLVNRTLNLAGKTLVPETVAVAGTVDIAFENATLVFPSDAENAVTLSGTCSVISVSSATVDIGSDTASNLTVSKSESFPDEVVQCVKSMTFKTVGINGTFVNTLPAGNDLAFTAKSVLFGIDKTAVLTSETASGTIDITNTAGVTVVPAASTIDFTADVALPGATTEHPSYVTVKDIVLGTDYTIGASFTLVTDWSEVTLDGSNAAFDASMDTGMNLRSVMKDALSGVSDTSFIDSIQINSLPVYLYMEKPNLDALKNTAFSGTVTASLGSTTVNILGNKAAGTTAELGYATVPDLAADSANMTTVTLTKDTASAYTDELKDIINSSDTTNTLKMDADLVMGGASGDITITRAQFDELSSSSATSIKMTAFIVLPFDFTIGSEINIDAFKIAGLSSKKDLFDRTEAWDISTYEKYLKAIQSVNFNLSISNTLGLSGVSGIITDGTGTTSYFKDITIPTSGKAAISLSEQSIEKILSSTSFMPTVVIKFPADSKISMQRDAGFAADFSVSVVTDGTITLKGGN